MVKKLLILLFIFITGVAGYYFGSTKKQPEKVIELENNSETKQQFITPNFQCPYVIKNSEFKNYTQIMNEVKIVGTPELIENSEVEKHSEPFILKEFEKGLYTLSTSKGWDSRKFDVDGDDKDETIIDFNVAMNHTPNGALIIKDGNIIFSTGGANIWISEVSGNKGFLLSENVEFFSEDKYTRYIPIDGGFKPIWTQKICWVSWE
jgi:hypothetical protein